MNLKDGSVYKASVYETKILKKAAGSNSDEKKTKKPTKDEMIQSLEIGVALLEEQLKHREFLEKIIWGLLATSLVKIVLDVLTTLR